MSLFNLKVPIAEKPIVIHPWANTIKDKYSNKIKHVHNSINNPNYPKEKKKRLTRDRTKFTIIGDRLNEDFIYCAKFIQDLHKYRPKYFDAPVIRGVTSVEWPDVLNQLKIEHGGLAFCLMTPVAILLNKTFLGGMQEFIALIETKYIKHLCLDFYHEAVCNFASYIRASGRPCAYMHISIDDKHVGTLIFMLFADIAPFTCDNFLRLCKEKRGGYSGTPVHRIVKDGWIQCGGFGLKNTDLDCENFIVPHDRRGVLGMANDGRHVDCSTQFFVLLQPATWMQNKYVAFGQLIDGAETLKTIENVPTFYESPKSNIIIYKAGILNLECHDIMINKNATEYVHGHIEDLIALGDNLFEGLLEKVFLEIEFKHTVVPDGGKAGEEESNQNVRETQRFLRRKEDIQSQLANRTSTAVSQVVTDIENNEFDVDEYAYEYEPEESMAKHDVSLEPSLIVKPEKPYYIPMTDVPYPGEVDSTFDLKKFLKGDYCLESDLAEPRKPIIPREKLSYISELMKMDQESDLESDESLDSDDERQVTRYLQQYTDRVSFTGNVVRHIAKRYGNTNVFENLETSELLTDDDLRRIKIAGADLKEAETHETRVSIRSPSIGSEKHSKIKRRQTGFVHPEDLPRFIRAKKPESSDQYFDDDDDDSDDDGTASVRKVRIVADSAQKDSNSRMSTRPARRPTGFVTSRAHADSDTEEQRPSVLTRLYTEVSTENAAAPTLKEYRPTSLSQQKNILLTFSSNSRMKREDSDRDTFMRHSLNVDTSSYDRVLTIQHGRKIVRKISSDYVKTLDQIEHKKANTLRTIEYAKTRPTLSVSEYQLKNKKYKEQKETTE